MLYATCVAKKRTPFCNGPVHHALAAPPDIPSAPSRIDTEGGSILLAFLSDLCLLKELSGATFGWHFLLVRFLFRICPPCSMQHALQKRKDSGCRNLRSLSDRNHQGQLATNAPQRHDIDNMKCVSIGPLDARIWRGAAGVFFWGWGWQRRVAMRSVGGPGCCGPHWFPLIAFLRQVSCAHECARSR